MKHEYTWNHLFLLAKICGRIDDEDSVTASWVQITEEHNRQTFPFTLWPLTYRTCEVTTSPAMCTPVHILTTDYSVKMFKSNEVVIICIQDGFHQGSRDGVCRHPCLADFDDVADDEAVADDDEAVETDACRSKVAMSDVVNHVQRHSVSASDPLLPCHEAHCYHRLKTTVNDAFYDIQDNVECVICVGHGESAAMASCLASDMSRTYEAEKEFLGLETTRVSVDFVGFSDSVVASRAYWDESSSSIAKYILVVFESCAITTSDANLVINPRFLIVTVDTSLPEKNPPMPRSVSVFNKLRVKTKTKRAKKEERPQVKVRHVSDYISALREKVNLPMVPPYHTKT
ncbi:unnamed protein product [Ectocarpus sp. 12 AP-2014]